MDNHRGQSGVVLMKGPQMMAGYKSNPEATRATIDSDGFLNTGDLGRFNPGSDHLIITGENHERRMITVSVEDDHGGVAAVGHRAS